MRTTASHASLRELADTYGTPLVVIDDETVRSRLRALIRSDHHRLALDLRGGIALSMLEQPFLIIPTLIVDTLSTYDSRVQLVSTLHTWCGIPVLPPESSQLTYSTAEARQF